MAVRRLAQRKEEILTELLGDRKPMVPDGVMSLLDTLQKNLVRSAGRGRCRPGCMLCGATGVLHAE